MDKRKEKAKKKIKSALQTMALAARDMVEAEEIYYDHKPEPQTPDSQKIAVLHDYTF